MRLRSANVRVKRRQFMQHPHQGTWVAQYVENGIPTMEIFWAYGRHRARGAHLHWLRSKVRRVR